MRRDKWVLVILIVVMGLILFLRPYYGWWLKSFVFPPLGGLSSESADLASENVALKSEVAELQSIKSQLKVNAPGADSVTAAVFSRYPFNFKSELLISAGSEAGISEGQPILYEGVLLGKIEKVFSNTALVMTIFDSRFQLAVRVGNGSVDALLRGGSAPQVALVDKKSPVARGDAVYSASPAVPYGLPVGEIGTVGLSADRLFLEAPLFLSYNLNDVRVVSVLKNVPQQ